MKYFMLNDYKRRGNVVKTDGRIQYEFEKGNGWVRSGVLTEYLNDESPLYDSYTEISEDEANKLISNI